MAFAPQTGQNHGLESFAPLRPLTPTSSAKVPMPLPRTRPPSFCPLSPEAVLLTRSSRNQGNRINPINPGSDNHRPAHLEIASFLAMTHGGKICTSAYSHICTSINQPLKLFPETIFRQRRYNKYRFVFYGVDKLQAAGMQANAFTQAAAWVAIFIIANNGAT
jgi:hypothetical protein